MLINKARRRKRAENEENVAIIAGSFQRYSVLASKPRRRSRSVRFWGSEQVPSLCTWTWHGWTTATWTPEKSFLCFGWTHACASEEAPSICVSGGLHRAWICKIAPSVSYPRYSDTDTGLDLISCRSSSRIRFTPQHFQLNGNWQRQRQLTTSFIRTTRSAQILTYA